MASVWRTPAKALASRPLRQSARTVPAGMPDGAASTWERRQHCGRPAHAVARRTRSDVLGRAGLELVRCGVNRACLEPESARRPWGGARLGSVRRAVAFDECECERGVSCAAPGVLELV